MSLTLKSVISAVNRTTPWGPHVAGRALATGPFSLEMWEQFHRWLLKTRQTSGQLQGGPVTRGGGSCVPSGVRGLDWGPGAGLHQKMGCLGGPAARPVGRRWEVPGVETVWLAERAWRLAAGGGTP